MVYPPTRHLLNRRSAAGGVPRQRCEWVRRTPGAPMPIRFNCSTCGANLKVPETMAGGMVKCPNCQGVVSVPSEDVLDAEEKPRYAPPEEPFPKKRPFEEDVPFPKKR